MPPRWLQQWGQKRKFQIGDVVFGCHWRSLYGGMLHMWRGQVVCCVGLDVSLDCSRAGLRSDHQGPSIPCSSCRHPICPSGLRLWFRATVRLEVWCSSELTHRCKRGVPELRVGSKDWDRVNIFEHMFTRQTARATSREGRGHACSPQIHLDQRVSYSVGGRIPA